MIGPTIAIAVPPIRRNYFGYKQPEPIPTSFPGMSAAPSLIERQSSPFTFFEMLLAFTYQNAESGSLA